MELRQPRKTVKKRSYWADTLALTHPKMIVILICIMSMGNFLSPAPFNWEIYAMIVLGLCFAILGSYRINEINDRTTSKSIPVGHHKVIAVIFIATAILIASYLSWKYEWWIIVLAIIGAVMMVVYNMDLGPSTHNRLFYGLVWGTLPLVFSEMTQSLNPVPTPQAVLFGGWAGVIAVLTLWLWGPTTCGRMEICSRYNKTKDRKLGKGAFTVVGKKYRRCHSPVLRCNDRLVMPKEVHNHMKVLIFLNDMQILVLTIAIAFIKFF